MSPNAVGQRHRHRLSKAISKFSIGHQPDSDNDYDFKSDSDPIHLYLLLQLPLPRPKTLATGDSTARNTGRRISSVAVANTRVPLISMS